jgi:hypothetical protein
MVPVFAGSSADAIVVEPVVLEVSAVELQVFASLLYRATTEVVVGIGGGVAGHCATIARLAEPTTELLPLKSADPEAP